MEILNELLYNIGKSSLPGVLGVTGIFTYMTIILVTAFYRIYKGDHMHH